MKVTLIMYLNQSILKLYQTYKNFLGKGSLWIIDSVIEHNISISKYNPLSDSSYIELPKELDYPRKRSINIKNIDDHECFKWSLVQYLNPADHHPTIITKADKNFAKKSDFKGIKLPVKIRDIYKIGKKNSIVFIVTGYENKEKNPIYVSKKCCEEEHVDLLLIRAEGKRLYVLIKDFNKFMYKHNLHCGKKHFCCYCL